MASVQLVAHRFEDRQRSDDVKVEENIDFSALLLSPLVQDGLTNAGFVKPSPIQLQAIPLGKFGLDLIVQAKSGTGKTCIFAVIALESIVLECTSVQTLVLAPTREIASQICEVVLSIGSSMPLLRCHYFIGGLPLAEDKVKLKKCHIAVGTPGRIKQLIECNYLSTSAIRLFVLDEADKLLDKDFQKSINWIYQKLPHNKQMLALSATYPESLAKLLTNYMRSPAFVRLNSQKPALLGVIQFYTITKFHPLPHVAFQHKFDMLQDILTNIPFSQCLIFINLQSRAQLLCDKLNKQGWASTYICGSQNQIQRLRTMAQLKSFQCRILVTTDLTARGIDCQNVDVIINVDLPKDLETYLHRVGRAGRFGSKGLAISIVSEGSEKDNLFSMNLSASLDICELPQPLSANVWNYNIKECSQNIEMSSDLTTTDSFICILNDGLLNNEEKVVPEEKSHHNSCSTLTHDQSNASNDQYITNKESDIELHGESEGSKENGIYSVKDNKHCDIIHTVSKEELEEKKCDKSIPFIIMNLKECTNNESNLQCIQEQNNVSISITEGHECLNDTNLSSKLAKNLKLTDTNDQLTKNAIYQQEGNCMQVAVNDLLYCYKMEPCVKDSSYTKIVEELDSFEVGNEFCSSEQCDDYVPSEELLHAVKNFLHRSNEQYWECLEATVNSNNTEQTKQIEFPVCSSSHESDFKTTSENNIFPCGIEIKHASADNYKVERTNKEAISLPKSKENTFVEEGNSLLLQTYNQLFKQTREIASDATIDVTNISKDRFLLKQSENKDNIEDDHLYSLIEDGNLDTASISEDLDSATTNKILDVGVSDCVSLSARKLNNCKEPSSNAMISAKNNIDVSNRAQKRSISLDSSINKSSNSQYSDSEETTSSESESECFEDTPQGNSTEQTFVPDYFCSLPAFSHKCTCNDNTAYMPSNCNASYGKGHHFDECKSSYEHLSYTPDCWQQSDYGYCSAQAENNYRHFHHKSQYAANLSCKCYMQYKNKHQFNPNFLGRFGMLGHFSNFCYSCYWDQCYAASQRWYYYYSMYMSEMLKWNRSQRRCSCCKCCK